MAFYVALDAGGTKTRCWVADAQRVLGAANGGTVKLMNVGEELATERLGEVVRAALAQASVSRSEVGRTCIGLAGSSSAAVRHWAQTTLHDLVGGDVLLAGDEQIALDAAFRGGPGVLVIAGTGSHVVGRTAAGERLTAGGWGPVLGDEGSGYWIGLEAVRAALRSKDQGRPGSLLGAVEHFWGLRDLGELVACGNRQPRPAFAELTALVVGCAEGGDAVAADVLERAGRHLARQVGLVLRGLAGPGAGEDKTCRIAWTGSVLEHIPAVRTAMVSALEQEFPQAKVDGNPVEPLEGALWQARRGGSESVRILAEELRSVDLAASEVRGD